MEVQAMKRLEMLEQALSEERKRREEADKEIQALKTKINQ
jgi:hypothetical protein